MQCCHYAVAAAVLLLGLLADADGSGRSGSQQEPPQRHPERGSGSRAQQEPPQRPPQRGSGSRAEQEPPQRPPQHGSGSRAQQEPPQRGPQHGSGSHAQQELAQHGSGSRAQQEPPQRPPQHGSGSRAQQEPPQRPPQHGSGSRAQQEPPQRPPQHDSESRASEKERQWPTRCGRPPQSNRTAPFPRPNSTFNGTARNGNHSALDGRPMPPNRTETGAIGAREGRYGPLPRPDSEAMGSSQLGPQNDDSTNPIGSEGVCPPFPPSDQPGNEVGGSLRSGSSSNSGVLRAAYDLGSAASQDPQRPDGLSRKGAILVAVGGALLCAGLVTLAVAVYLHKRSLDKVRAAVAERHNAVAPIPTAWNTVGANLPDVVIVDCVEVSAKECDVCIGMVVHDAPAKLV